MIPGLPGGIQDFFNQRAFAVGIGFTVIVVFLCQAVLQFRVACGVRGMTAQVIAEQDLDLEEITAGFDNMQVVGVFAVYDLMQVAPFGKDRFVFWYILVPQGLQGRDEGRGIGDTVHSDQDVDHRFGSETGNCGTADVLYAA